MKRIFLNIFFVLLLLTSFISPCHAIRVGLSIDVNQASVGTSVTGDVLNAHNNKLLLHTEAMKPYLLKPRNNTITIKAGAKTYDLETNFIRIKPQNNNAFVATKNRWYRGEIIVYNFHNKLTVINRLPIELYLLGVVPSEMPSSWNTEAHKAQAIAARSYAIANLNKHGKRSYDLLDNTFDQAYGGATAETKKTNQAVIGTKGIVITYKGKVIPAYYHASSGGVTVNSGAAWASDAPYLHSVKGFDDGLKKNGHGVGMSQNGANNLASKGYSAYDILRYYYKDIDFSRMPVTK